MPTIWGSLERIETVRSNARWIQTRVTLPGGSVIRVRTCVGAQALVARGIERVDLSTLCAGELVEVSFHYGRDGLMEAETIYIQPEHAAV
ncbi:MAG: hypothetical protein HY038_08615 [Nitrospirae bacterium]|nr:hypothetical protein [Nitrospirota bacterium]